MLTSFVGRTRELRRLARLLDEGRSIVLTGVFGSGRTMLVRQLADNERSRQFVFWDSCSSQRALRITVEKLWAARAVHNSAGDRTPPVVVVIDDVIQITPQRLRTFRGLVRAHRCQVIVIVERSVPSFDVTRLRAALDAASLLRLGPLSRSATERYVSLAARDYRFGWTADEIRSTARSTHGHPLTMRATLEAAVAARQERGVSHGTVSGVDSSSLERHFRGDGVRR
jgi:hypothetical protein